MNEQIQKLAELAGFNLHNDLIDGHNFHHEIEKFAQLIVGECASMVDTYGRWILYDKLAVKLKKDFGVEE